VVADDEPIAELDDPDLWLFRDRVFDVNGDETHDFWLAASVESNLLPAPESFSAAADSLTWRSHTYPLASVPARVNMRLRLSPIGLDVLQDLVDSGDLDPAFLANTSTFDVAPTVLEWTPATAEPSMGMVDYGTCVSSSPGCIAPDLK
jgi:hypothetical protein